MAAKNETHTVLIHPAGHEVTFANDHAERILAIGQGRKKWWKVKKETNVGGKSNKTASNRAKK
jgi:ABC-type phosphate/phosphonate transport system ATPase subunit